MNKTSENEILRSNELTGVIGRNEMDLLRGVYGEDWDVYRKKNDEASELVVHDFPIQLDIELNASCNLRCPMCPISAESVRGKGPSTWFDFSKYKELVDFAVENGTKALKLNYINEPLIRKDFFEFVEYARRAGILDLYFSTNGMLMSRKISEKIIKTGVTRVQVSIDATTHEIYDEMRPGGDLEVVVKNVDELIKLKNEMGSILPLIRVNFVKTEINEHQLDEFIKIWRDKVDMVGVQEFVKPTKSARDLSSKTTYKKSNIGFSCSFPFKQLVINNEHKVLPCCTFWGEELALGELLFVEDLKKFWYGTKMTELRKMHREGRYHEIPQCRNCIDGGNAA